MNESMIIKVRERLVDFGQHLTNLDSALISFSTKKAEDTIKNDCNLSEIPDGLMNIAVDMAVGEFLLAKKTFAPNEINNLDLTSPAVKQLQIGDTSTTFAIGSGSMTDEQRMDCLINHLLTSGREQFSCYRKLRW